MLTTYLKAPYALERLRCGPGGRYLDGFAGHLHAAGYAPPSTSNYVGAAAHLAHWLERRRFAIGALDEATLEVFRRHLPRCACAVRTRRFSGTVGACRHFLAYLRAAGVAPAKTPPARHPLLADFHRWTMRHRGLRERTLDRYCRKLEGLVAALGDDPSCYNGRRLREFIVRQVDGRPGVRNLTTAARAFFQYLVAAGQCKADIEIPIVAHWSRATLPRYLHAPEVERIIASCEPGTPAGIRDRAILLLLARLGLRAGDVRNLKFGDIDWREGSLRVGGKARREARLPLPQEVGDAILAYLEERPRVDSEKIFLRAIGPRGPLAENGTVSAIVREAIRRAGVSAPSRGAHILRHSAATEMLNQGASLRDIARVLRHESIETTTIYAKVHTSLLQQVAQPFPGSRPSC